MDSVNFIPSPIGLDNITIEGLPRIVFGNGVFQRVPQMIRNFGHKVLIVTGARSFRATLYWQELLNALQDCDIRDLVVDGEPGPDTVDEAVSRFAPETISVVVGIGGGSVLDAGKAIAGLLPSGNSVLDYLEGVGKGLKYEGPSLPYIAIPTTAGTGSEATKNAVLSLCGERGYKKSFRHDTLVPDYAVVDPDLLASCAPAQIAANGMDAFTQLLESYVSTRANPFTDALAWSGLQYVSSGFLDAWRGGETAVARSGRSGSPR